MKNLKLINLFVFSLFLSTSSWAHCPLAFTSNSEPYCLDVEWQKAESRPQGDFVASKSLSPFLNPTVQPSQQRLFSKAHIAVWKDGDRDHVPVYLSDLVIYPYMVMAGGHSHGARSTFVFDDDLQLYVLSAMAFQEMSEGCWQLRLKAADSDELVLMNIESFTNLTADENYNQALMCSLCSSAPTNNPQHHH